MANGAVDLVVGLYCPSRDCLLLHLDLEVEGVLTTFIVDTGCKYSMVSLEQVAAWGLEDEIEKLPYRNSPTMGYVRVKFSVEGTDFPVLFLVGDTPFNLFGLNSLQSFLCVIDMDLTEPSFRFRRTLAEPLVRSLRHVRRVVRVAGRDVEVVVDTGAMAMVTGPLSVAEDLALELEDVEDAAISFSGVGYSAPLKHVAKNVLVEAFG